MKNNILTFGEVFDMAKIDFVEKEYFEQLFGMRSGYVLDFSNRSFQEFVYSIIKN